MATDPLKAIEAVGDVIKTVPEVYKDVAQPAAQQTGSLLGRIPRAINAALSPLDIWIAKKEYNVAETKKLLEIKLQKIDPDKIVPPEPYVAVPAIQALSYSMDSDELREMYANLLANSMNSDSKNNVHPSFVEIIKQMSPLDASLFKAFNEVNQIPLLTIRKKKIESEGEHDLFRYFSSFALKSINVVESVNAIAESIDNLLRCVLIEIPDLRSYTNKEVYGQLKTSPTYLQLREHIETQMLSSEDQIVEEEKLIRITDMGRSFYKICIKD